jgi:hypothetical protein
MDSEKIIEITPELERRVLAERRKDTRAKMADMEMRLAQIATLVAQRPNDWTDEERIIYRLAKGYRKAGD